MEWWWSKIERVDVSVDGGASWPAAELYKPIEQRYNHHWAWTQFNMTMPLPAEIQEKLKRGETAELDITSKALDSAFTVQPERMEPYWKYHVKVKLNPNLPKGEIIRHEPEEGFANTPTGGHFDCPWRMGDCRS